MRSKKAAIELSLNFIIGMIMGVVLLSLGLVFAYKIVAGGDKILSEGLPDTYKVMADNCVQNGKRICIPEIKKDLKTREGASFGIVINNVYGDTRQFKIYVKFGMGVLDNGTKIPSVDLSKWTFPESAPQFQFMLENNKYNLVEIPVLVPKGTKTGTYVFNVNVCFNANDNPQPAKCSLQGYPSLYDVTQQITVNVI